MQGGKKKKEGKNDAWRWLTPPFSISPLLSSGWKREAHVRTEKDARSPSFSPSLPLPFLSILRTTTHRFPTRQRGQRCVCVCVFYFTVHHSLVKVCISAFLSPSLLSARGGTKVSLGLLSLGWTFFKKKKKKFIPLQRSTSCLLSSFVLAEAA